MIISYLRLFRKIFVSYPPAGGGAALGGGGCGGGGVGFGGGGLGFGFGGGGAGFLGFELFPPMLTRSRTRLLP